MTQINRALYGGMPAADAAWMEDYLRRVRGGLPTFPEEDARGMRAMAAAVSRLPEASRERLRTILEHAITVALRPGGGAAATTDAAEATEVTEPDVDPAFDEP